MMQAPIGAPASIFCAVRPDLAKRTLLRLWETAMPGPLFWLRSATFGVVLFGLTAAVAADGTRRPANDGELQIWLENMLIYHRFTRDDVAAATGLAGEEIDAAVK